MNSSRKRSPFPLVAALAALLEVASPAVAADTTPTIGRVDFVGHRFLSSAQLAKEMTSARRRAFILPRRFDELDLENDLRRLLARYRREGFLYATVSADSIARRGRMVDITVTIAEETRVILRSSSIDGSAGRLTLPELSSLMRLRAGRPYNPEEIAEARTRILRRLAEEGYAFAEIVQTFTVEGDRADVMFRVFPGPLVTYGVARIEGENFVEEEAILREIGLRRGDLLRRRALLRAQRRLTDRDLFRSVSIAPIRPAAEQDATEADLKVRVEEKPLRWIAVRAGYGTTDRFHGGAEWGHRNLDGLGRRFSIEGAASATRVSAAALLSEPWPVAWASTGRLRAGLEDDIREAFTERKQKAAASLEIPWDDVTKLEVGVEAALSELRKVLPNATREVLGDVPGPRYATGTLSAAIERNTLDDRVFPRRGVRLRAGASLIAGDIEAWRTEAHAGRAIEMGERTVLALGATIGWAGGWGGTDELPASMRYFLGGEENLRGFRRDEVGPVDANKQPTGGEFSVLGQAEVRFFATDRGHGALFLDVGQVFRRASDFRVRSLAADVGLGFRYHTPFGPIRLDYAWPIGDGALESGRLNLAVGYAF